MKGFAELASALHSWPDCGLLNPDDFQVSSHVRLVAAMRSIQRSHSPRAAKGDLGGLVRHVLRRESLKRNDPELDITAPTESPWPNRADWKRYGMEVVTDAGQYVRLRALPWHPEWLDGSDPTTAAFKEEKRREPYSAPSDPLFEHLTGYPTYTSPGQRDAVRSAFLLAPGETLVVNLPTGSGKSLVFQAPVLKAAQDNKISIVVVPTTALALDQERRFKDLQPNGPPHPLAYHSGLPDQARKQFRERVRNGQQKIVISSPEAVLSSLRLGLERAAENGRLAWFVVDEAHIVGDWGTGFRPEFQLLGGLRDYLCKKSTPNAAPRTLLLSATISEDSLRTLRTVFGGPRGCGLQVISAVHLRPEPEYWIASAINQDERKNWIKDALRHVPRPFLLYVSLRKDAKTWKKQLDELGIHRVEVVIGGDMAKPSGQETLKRWNNRDLDGVIANSAFGLGMDQADVRTVIHACIPETIHRYYQEVGRGGRDGNAALSLLVYTPNDWKAAGKLGKQRQIGLELGYKRWRTMWTGRERLGIQGDPDAFQVNLNARHSDIRGENDANIAWNLRTLTLMAQAGLIRLYSPDIEVPQKEPGEDEDVFQERWREEMNAAFNRAGLILETPRHRDQKYWNSQVDLARQVSKSVDRKALAAMRKVAESNEELSEIFKAAYTLAEESVYPRGPRGNCPYTRNNGSVSWEYDLPIPSISIKTTRPVPEELLNTHKWISYENPGQSNKAQREWEGHIATLLKKLTEVGIEEVALDCSLREKNRIEKVLKKRFIAVADINEAAPSLVEGEELPLHRLSILPPSVGGRPYPLHLVDFDNRPSHIVVFPHDVRDSQDPHRTHGETRNPISLKSLLENLM